MSEIVNKNLERSWNWVSNNNSTQDPAVSVLGIFETIIALGISMLACFYGYTLHLIFAVVIAPLLLLRNQISDFYAFEVGYHLLNAVNRFYPKIKLTFFGKILKEKSSFKSSRLTAHPLFLLSSILYLPASLLIVTIKFSFNIVGLLIVTALALISARAAGIIYAFFCSPLVSIKSIPNNLWIVCAYTDLTTPIETLSGLKEYRGDRSTYWNDLRRILNIRDTLSAFDSMNRPSTDYIALEKMIFNMIVGTAIIILYFPVLVYRLSLKSSALIYLPLIWVINTSINNNIINRLKEVVSLSISKFRLVLAVLLNLIVATKLAAFNFWASIEEKLSLESSGFIKVFLAPAELPIWQIASALNGLLAWIAFFKAESVLLKYSDGSGLELSNFDIFQIRLLWFLSGVLTCYTIPIMIYNAFSVHWHLMPIGGRWFPW